MTERMRRLGEGEARERWVREWRTSPLSELLETSPRDIGWRGGGGGVIPNTQNTSTRFTIKVGEGRPWGLNERWRKGRSVGEG